MIVMIKMKKMRRSKMMNMMMAMMMRSKMMNMMMRRRRRSKMVDMMTMMMMMIVCNRGGAGGEGRRQQQEPLAALGTPRVLSFVFLHGFMIRLGKRIIQVKDCERKCIFDLIKKDSWHAPSLYSLSFLSPLYPSSSH